MVDEGVRWLSEDTADCTWFRVTRQQLDRAMHNLDVALCMILEHTEYEDASDDVQEFIRVMEDLYDRARRCSRYGEHYIWIPRDALVLWRDVAG